jgi:2'-5' RNA ligase
MGEDAVMTQRLFAAIWPSADARDDLRGAVAAVRRAHPQLRWLPPERWHVTVAFLGQADADRATERLDAMLAGRRPHRGGAVDQGPEPIRLAGSGSFGPVLWVGVEHGPWLADLARRVQRALRTEDRRFRAHVTVARCRGRDANRAARAAVPALAGLRTAPWTPDELTLVASITGPHPRYDVLRAWPLADSAASSDKEPP